MSSLSRRACYKCGNVGHYAEVCASSERLCYNCKQPGKAIPAASCHGGMPNIFLTASKDMNRMAARNLEQLKVRAPGIARPLEYTFTDIRPAAKQCYHCQGLGHVQADCPTLRISGASTGGRCYSCGQPGHLARACPNNGFHAIPPMGIGRGNFIPRGGFGGGFRGGFAGGPRPATCYKCGGPNHYARDCQAQSMKCYACGKLGHISRDCTAPNGGPLNAVGKVCYKCGQAGHISRECTTVDTNGQIVSDAPVDTINQVQLATTTAVVQNVSAL